MKSTFDLFWRMVYEQNITIIVMITHLFESGKVNRQSSFRFVNPQARNFKIPEPETKL